MEFYVGDKVKVVKLVRAVEREMKQYVGETGYIKDIETNPFNKQTEYNVTFYPERGWVEYPDEVLFIAEELELVE